MVFGGLGGVKTSFAFFCTRKKKTAKNILQYIAIFFFFLYLHLAFYLFFVVFGDFGFV